jgi:hypothetical protein
MPLSVSRFLYSVGCEAIFLSKPNRSSWAWIAVPSVMPSFSLAPGTGGVILRLSLIKCEGEVDFVSFTCDGMCSQSSGFEASLRSFQTEERSPAHSLRGLCERRPEAGLFP